MFLGAGWAPMMNAAPACNGLVGDISTAAAPFTSVTSGLTAPARMSRVPWSFRVSIRLRSPRRCARRVRQIQRNRIWRVTSSGCFHCVPTELTIQPCCRISVNLAVIAIGLAAGGSPGDSQLNPRAKTRDHAKTYARNLWEINMHEYCCRTAHYVTMTDAAHGEALPAAADYGARITNALNDPGVPADGRPRTA